MKHRKLFVTLIALLGLSAFLAVAAWRAHRNLVTLHEHNVPFAKVMRKVAWQTWERFEWHKNIQGNVTIDVDSVPLETAMEIIGEQVSARPTVVYPLYRRKSSLGSLDKAVKGEIEFKQSSFTNWTGRVAGMRGGFGPFRAEAPTNGISLILSNKDLVVASLALSQAGRAEIVPENGLTKKVTLTLTGEPLEQAVKKVAKQAGLSWTKFYAFQPAGGFGMAGGRSRGEPGREIPVELREQMNKRSEELLATLPPEQQEKARENREMAQVMRELPQEARQQIMSERMNTPEVQQRMDQRTVAGIKNSTPEQRRERFERMYAMRKARAAGVPVSRGPRAN